jgi:hypothetical protein
LKHGAGGGWRRSGGPIVLKKKEKRKTKEILHRVKEERSIARKIKRSKANWIGHILLRSCLLRHVIEGKIEERTEVTERRGRRCKHLMDDLRVKIEYWKLKQEALDRTEWRTRFEKGCGPVVRHTTKRMNDDVTSQKTRIFPSTKFHKNQFGGSKACRPTARQMERKAGQTGMVKLRDKTLQPEAAEQHQK